MKFLGTKFSIGLAVFMILPILVFAQEPSANNENTEKEDPKKESKEEKAYDSEYNTSKWSYNLKGEIHYNDIVQDVNQSNVAGEFDFHDIAFK